MTIRSTIAKAGPYIANGMTAVYPFTFKALDPSHVRVEHEGPIFSYEVRLLEGGGEVVFSAPVPAGTRLTILRDVPVSQETDLQNNTAFYPEVIETALDKIVMICQQFREELLRCVKVAATDGQKPEEIIAMILGAKDIALTAAEGAANANASASAAALTVQTIWSEITGNDASAQEALEALKQAFEAAGSVEAAAAAGRESVNAASLAAVEYANQQINESKDASVAVISATTQNRKAELLALISETIGAEGAVAEAVKAAEEAAINAKEAANSIDAATQEALASVNAAVGVADEKRQEAQAAATEAKAQAEQAGDAAAESYGYIAETLANKNASAQSAQDAAQSAASAQIAADAAAAAAGEAAQRSITAHNSNVTSHPDMRELIDGKLSTGGGQMSGDIYKNTDDGALRLFGGTGDDKGAEFNICGAEHPHMPGCIQLVARAADGTTKALNLFPDGRLQLDGNEVITSAGGRMFGSITSSTGTDNPAICYTNGAALGGQLWLFNRYDATYKGGFILRAMNDSGGNIDFIGYSDGGLAWGGKPIERIESYVWNYIRYTSGLQICWGKVGAGTGTWVGFPVAFANTSYTPVVQVNNDNGTGQQIAVGDLFTTGMNVHSKEGDAGNNPKWWLAIGRWA